MVRREKISDVLEVIHAFLDNSRYTLTKHAQTRMKERNVNLPEVLEVLRNGYHEERKDQYDEIHRDWSYAIRSQTTDDRSLRVAVAIEEAAGIVVITVIDLES